MFIPLAIPQDDFIKEDGNQFESTHDGQPALLNAKEALVELGYHGKHDSWVGVIPAARDAVKSMINDDRIALSAFDALPDNLKPPSSNQYPVMILAGRQRDVAPGLTVTNSIDIFNIAGNIVHGVADALGFSMNYLEAIALVPFTTRDGNPELLNFAQKLYVNDTTAKNLGQLLFFPKEESQLMEMAVDRFTARDEDAPATPVVSVFEPDLSFRNSIPGSAPVQMLRDIFSMPILGSFARLGNSAAHSGSAPFSICRSEWKLTAKHIKPAAVECNISDQFCAAASGATNVDPLADSVYGSFWMQNVPWTIPAPSFID